MKVHIHLNVDHEKKMLFESLKEVHGKTFTDILEEGLDACLSEIVPSKLMEEEIAQTRSRLMELEQNLVKIRMIEQQRKLQNKAAKKEDSIAEDYLEIMRNQRFEESRDSLFIQWKRLDMNWPRIVDLFQFKNATEAKAWFAKKMIGMEL
ncbi:hypothetical protein [Methanolobus halotolerans]|uniref:Uncharacterized protein n=1 Tax=Methanolobus halotolerans TaxID=2052935 RepID=A0A4E0PSZ5_9EURY|nr:hypothetical protein [Methanolobus halotolerans]TGC07411.1 hypothetical protein CUN85_11440 [Methanolobus halotolerans]